jgi:hypothetical protein
MNRQSFLSLSLLAPVAGVMAARDAMASYASGGWVPGRTITLGEFVHGDAFIGESVGETTEHLLERAHRSFRDWEQFGVDDVTRADALAFVQHPAEDESVVAQFESDLAFLRDEPGMVS